MQTRTPGKRMLIPLPLPRLGVVTGVAIASSLGMGLALGVTAGVGLVALDALTRKMENRQ
jgi:hypothetical protein